MNRRQFAKNTVMATALTATLPITGFSEGLPQAKRTIKKGVMWGSIAYGTTILEKFQNAKAAGFDGVEPMSHLNRDEVLAAAKATGLKIPSVCGTHHWKYLLNDPDPAIRKQGVDALIVSIEDAKIYGADTVLLVPGRVSETNTYDDCWKLSMEGIKQALPLAEQSKIKIAVENVWNNFLLSPLEAAYYIDQFDSQYVKAYFDCGNILVYGWPEQWIKILGKRLAKVHIKEFDTKIAGTKGKGAGFGVKLQEGSVNWKAVMKSMDDIGYGDWTTIEQPGGDTPEGLKDLCLRLNNIINL
ncbi:MAG: sugar phosphate isomerase/epimerase family protein [Mariniphaga sp.]